LRLSPDVFVGADRSLIDTPWFFPMELVAMAAAPASAPLEQRED
jgi:hypothetical protein